MSTVLIENIVTQQCLDDALAALQATCCQPLPTAGDSGAGSIPVAGPLVIAGAGNVTTSASGNTITVAGVSSALIDNGDGTYSFMPGDGSAPTEILTSTLVANADGSYTFTGADGSTVVIPADCCPTLTDNGDGTFTFTAGDGSTVTFATHPATTVTSNAAPFSWDGAAQTLNVPQAPSLVANADGSYTFTAGNGSAPVVIPADCCPTLTANADGSFTFTAGDGSTVTIPALPLDVQLANAVIDTATNELVLTLNDGTEYRVPLSALLPVVTDGVTVVGDGTVGDPLSAGYFVDNGDGTYTWNGADGSSFTIPADCCPTLTDNGDGTFTFTAGDGSTVTFATHPATTVTSNAAPFSWNAATQTLNVPQAPMLVLNADGSYTFTAGNGSAPVVIPADCCPTLTDNGDGTFTFTDGDGNTVTFATHPAAAVTNNAAPFAWNGTTQVLNVPQAPTLVANADGSYTFTAGDGSAPVIIPADCCPTLVANGDGSFTFTAGDGSTVVIPALPLDIRLANAVIDTATNEMVLTLNDGTEYRVPLSALLPVVSDGVTVVGDGTVGDPLSAGYLANNGNGTYTWHAADGSSFTIPADCCPTLTDNGDGTYTFTAGDGSTTTIAVHPAAALTNNAAPFAWNGTTQAGNIPQSPVLTLTASGFTFTSGDGSAPVSFADKYVTGFSIAGNLATITLSNGTTFTQTIPTTIDINVQSFSLSGTDLILTETDGTVHTVALPQEIKVSAVGYVAATGILTVTNSDGTSVTTTIPTHPAATVTNNATPFAWDAATQTLNVPQAPALVANADGTYTFTAGDGSAPVIIPADCCPTLIDNGDGTYTFTAGDGSTTTITVHPAAALTNNAAPFAWNGTTQAGNIPQSPALVDNGDGSYTFTAGDGSAPVTIPSYLLTGLNGLLNGLTTTQQIADAIDNWTKRVINPGATLPIAAVADAGVQPLLTTGQFQVAETDDVIPTIGSDGVLRMRTRQISAKFTNAAGQSIPVSTRTTVLFPTTEYNTAPTLIVPLGAGQFRYAGLNARAFKIDARVMFSMAPGFVWNHPGEPEYGNTEFVLWKNGVFLTRLWDSSFYGHDVSFSPSNGSVSPQGSTSALLQPGDVIHITVWQANGTALSLYSGTGFPGVNADIYLCINGAL